jgi:hypothetical protein
MRRVMSGFGFFAALVLFGCGSGGIEEGIPQGATGADFSKVPDPMAGVKLHSTAKGKPVFNDPMNPSANK